MTDRITAGDFRLIADSAPVPMWVTDLNRRRSFVNKAYVGFVGGDYADATALDWRTIIHPEDAARITAESTAGEASLGTFTLEARYRRADGEWRWLQSVSQPRWGSGGEHDGFIGVAHDVTERHEAEASLRQSAESLRLAIEGAGMATWEADLRTARGRWSPNRFDLLGYPRTDDHSGSVDDWLARVHPDDEGIARDAVARCFGQGEPYNIDYRIRRPDGIRWLQSHGSRIDYRDGRPSRFVGVSFDITERKTAEARQQLLIDELNHRVKNMLAIVQGIAHQTLKPDVDPLAARAAFEGRLAALAAAHNLLTDQHWSPVPMRRVIEETIAPHGRPQAFRLAGPDLLVAPKTAVSIALAIHELATNAVKYGALSVAQGSVAVDWSTNAGEGEQRLRMEWRERGGPSVAAPARRGFGTRMIERGLAAELNGTVSVTFAAEGVRCVVDAPLPAEGRG
ncbi:sensor histidine kinase [Sphingomonas guangdongensis]|uniref:sensor histidine kinase n=1 Tax=Sphingomonas guangdongensis TaxID=1141890 RepID=UPI002481B197|nr:PAS domain-containing protein [Sphingomonas guangdongensis]